MIKDFTGHIEVGGETKYKRVSGTYEILVEPNGMKSWYGSFDILSGEIPELVEGVLHTDKGEKGRIIVSRITHFSSEVEFQGSGPIE